MALGNLFLGIVCLVASDLGDLSLLICFAGFVALECAGMVSW